METWITPVLLGVGLAAASGLRAFLPLLLAALSARFGWFGVELEGQLAWLSSDAALWALGVAAALETLGDKVPVVDHALDGLSTVVRPAAGAFALFAVSGQVDPVVAGALAVMVGAPTALAVHGAKAGTRAVSTAATGGLGNPVLSFLEDALTAVAVALMLLAPVLVPVLLLLAAYGVYRGLRALGRRRQPQGAAARV